MNEENSMDKIIIAIIIASIFFAVIIFVLAVFGNSIINTGTERAISYFLLIYTSPSVLDRNNINFLDVKTYNSTHLNFNGTSTDCINLTAMPDMSLGKNYTVFVRFKTNSNTSLQTLFSQSSTDNNRVTCAISNSEIVCNNFNGSVYDSANTYFYNRDIWHTLILTQNYSNTTQIYLDGVKGGKSHTITTSGTGILQIGCRYQLYNFNGSIDNFLVLNQTAGHYLTDAIDIPELIKTQTGDRYLTVLEGHHLVFSPEIANEPTEVNETTFREILNTLKNLSYESITFDEYYNYTQGISTIPERSFIYTWDDEFSSVMQASEIMDEYGYVGVVAIATENVGGANTMSWYNLTQLANKGWGFTSHSVNHCDHITECNQTINWTYQMNNSYYAIIGNTSVKPITYIYPHNQFNSSTMAVCDDYYSICFGQGWNMNKPNYILKMTNLTNGNLERVATSNMTTLTDLQNLLNYSYLNQEILRYNFNENNGSIVYDNTASANNGIIMGATWGNNGILNTLVEGIDYTISTSGLFTLVNTNYLYSWINVTINYNKKWNSDAYRVSENLNTGFNDLSDFIAIYIIIGVFVVIVTIIIIIIKNLRNYEYEN